MQYLTREQMQLLEELLRNENFHGLLKAMVSDYRSSFLASVESGFVSQNTSAAGVAFGRLLFAEELPDWFVTVYQSNLSKMRSAT
jgi:hypothetical protein